MKVLSNEQVNNVTGGFFNFAFGAGVGLGGYLCLGEVLFYLQEQVLLLGD